MSSITNHYPTIAYICLEFGLDDTIKTYAGGLGILAGDTIKTAADLELPFVGISLLYKHGYFKQIVDAQGNQSTTNDDWDWTQKLTKVREALTIQIGSITLITDVWRYDVQGESMHVPLYYMDFDLEQNAPEYRNICSRLYPQDDLTKRLQQIIIGYAALQVYESMLGQLPDIVHINESHAAYSILHLLKTHTKEEIRSKFVFTTHTPVVAGHEKHKISDVWQILGEDISLLDESLRNQGILSLSEIAIYYSKYTNAVSKKHMEVTQSMFPGAAVDWITNGVHPQSWISPHFKAIFDANIPDWKSVPAHFRKALVIPNQEIKTAHQASKNALNDYLQKECGVNFDPTIFTIGFARRSAFYKRNDLIFSDYDRLNAIGAKYGKIQLVFSGKAHPNDLIGQSFIKKIISYTTNELDNIEVVYIPDYGMEISLLLVAGVDIWLNNPIVPMEASGTSGMKASMNGVPSLSTLDGWWKEGSYEGLTGWSIGGGCEGEECGAKEISEMYDQLEHTILPLYYDNPEAWINVQKHCIALNGSYFNTKRMMEEYLLKAYLRG